MEEGLGVTIEQASIRTFAGFLGVGAEVISGEDNLLTILVEEVELCEVEVGTIVVTLVTGTVVVNGVGNGDD